MSENDLRYEQARPLMPMDLSNPELRLVRQTPQTPVLQSYLEQQYTLLLPDGRYLLKPGAASDGAAEPPPLALPLHMLSGWHAHGPTTSYRGGSEAHERLRSAIEHAGGGVLGQAIAYPVDRAWYEPSWLGAGLDGGTALRLAAEAGQLATVRWDAETLTVLRTDPGAALPPVPWRLERQVGRPCPVRQDDQPRGVCRVYGGPFGSRAIHARVLWQDHRHFGLRLLGCDPCDDATLPIEGPHAPQGGGIRSPGDAVLGSRHGGYAFRA